MEIPKNPSAAFRAANPHIYGTENIGKISHPEQRERADELDHGNERKAQGAGCPAVCFTLRRVKLLDVDAKYGSCKDLLDGLQHAGLIRGDKEGEITLEVRQEKVPHYAEEETIISISY